MMYEKWKQYTIVLLFSDKCINWQKSDLEHMRSKVHLDSIMQKKQIDNVIIMKLQPAAEHVHQAYLISISSALAKCYEE